MSANRNFNRLVGATIVLGLLMGCSYLWGSKTKFERVAALLALAEEAPDFATKESYINQVMALDPSKWRYLSSLYMEQARAQEQLEGKLLYLQRVLEVVHKYSIDYHSLEAYRVLGSLYYKHHTLDQALVYYKKMIDIELRYLARRRRHNLFFESLLAQYPEDCLTLGKVYLDIGDRVTALHYLKESSKYFHELPQSVYKDKHRFSYLADKFIQLARIYEGLGLDEQKISCYEMGLRFKLLDLDSRIDSGKTEHTIEKELKGIIEHWQVNHSEFITNGRLWAKFLLAKYYHESGSRGLAVDLVIQVLDSNFENLPDVGNIMTVIRYVPWRLVFKLEEPHTIHIMGHNRRLLRLVLQKYQRISNLYYNKITLGDLHSWLLISLLAEDYTDVDLILEKTLDLEVKKKVKLWNIILHNIGVVYFRKSDYNNAGTYLKQYYDFTPDVVATFNLAVLYLAMNDFDQAQRLLVQYEKKYPMTVFSPTVKKYLQISREYLTAGHSDAHIPIKLEQGIVPIAK